MGKVICHWCGGPLGAENRVVLPSGSIVRHFHQDCWNVSQAHEKNMTVKPKESKNPLTTNAVLEIRGWTKKVRFSEIQKTTNIQQTNSKLSPYKKKRISEIWDKFKPRK